MINDIFITMKKKIIKLTEGELTNLIKRILKEDSTTNNCIKEYKSPYPGDPYEYRIGEECLWETRSDKSKKQTGKEMPDWVSLYKNVEANKKLDKWFPNAKSDCSKCKGGEKNNLSDCPKKVNCQPGVSLRPKICNDPKTLKMCERKGTIVTY